MIACLPSMRAQSVNGETIIARQGELEILARVKSSAGYLVVARLWVGSKRDVEDGKEGGEIASVCCGSME